MANKQNLAVDVAPEFLAIINASTAVSTTKGSSAMLMKVTSKRRRTRAEMEEFRAMGDRKSQMLARKDEHIGHLESELHASKSKLQAA